MTDDIKKPEEYEREINEAASALNQTTADELKKFDAALIEGSQLLTEIDTKLSGIGDDMQSLMSETPPAGSESEYAKMIEELEVEAKKDEE